MSFLNCTIEDIDSMIRFYDWGRELQQEKSNQNWQNFDRDQLAREIAEKRQWKIVEDGVIVCIFMTAYDDPYIWGEKNKDPSVYIHRIVTHPQYRGRNYVRTIIEWAKGHARELGKKFLRMDTWGDNPKLNDYYVKCGFTYLETITPETTENLPKHYSCISLSLLEMKIDEDHHE
jgi:ribosomal protein S18 acetylase RimI-like enzyme